MSFNNQNKRIEGKKWKRAKEGHGNTRFKTGHIPEMEEITSELSAQDKATNYILELLEKIEENTRPT